MPTWCTPMPTERKLFCAVVGRPDVQRRIDLPYNQESSVISVMVGNFDY